MDHFDKDSITWAISLFTLLSLCFISDAYKSSELALYIDNAQIIIPPTIKVSKYDFLGFETKYFNESFGRG